MQSPDVTDAVDIAFDLYFSYCTSPREDTLFNLLTALVELNGIIASSHDATFDFAEFVALRALCKHVSSVTYARHVLRLKHLPAMPLVTDTRQACLVSRADCIAALMRATSADREALKRAFQASFKQWGTVVDVNPSVFNCMVKVYEVLRLAKLAGVKSGYLAFEESWEYGVLHELPHYVTGPVPRDTYTGSELERLMAALYAA